MYYEINSNTLPFVRLIDIAVLKPPYIHKRRQANEYILYIIKNGTLYISENNIDYKLQQGDIILLDPNFIHEGYKASDCEYFYIHFQHSQIYCKQQNDDFIEQCLKVRSMSLQGDNCSSSQNTRILLPKHFSMNTGTCYLHITKLIQEALEQNRNRMEGYKIYCACKIIEAFIEIGREYISSMALEQLTGIPKSYGNVNKVLNYLNTNYHKQISSTMLEQLFLCNFDYLNRVFKKNIGKTIFAYLNEVRIYHAKELIATTSMKIASIGYRVGFQDECYFSKVFKKYTGMSPGQYEKLTSNLEVNCKPAQ